MNHYTYLLQSNTDDIMYIGVRSCQGMPEDDNYWGTSKHIPKNVSEVCDKFILGTFDTRVDAVADEIRRHNINDVAKSKYFWNKAKQTATGFDRSGTDPWNKDVPHYSVHTVESRKKISDSLRGHKDSQETIEKRKTSNAGYVHSEETITKLSLARKGKPSAMKGKQHTDEARAIMSAKAKLRTPRTGWKHTDEAKAKISSAKKGTRMLDEWKSETSKRMKGNQHTKGRVCVNNGVEIKMVYKDNIPSGFKLGRKL